MEVWKSESNPGKQMLLSIVCVAIGLVLAIGFHSFAGSGMSNSKAGFLLGLILLVIGLIGLAMQTKQTVVVDPTTRSITIDDKGYFGTKRRQIGFGDVADVSIGFLGKKSNYVNFYYLVLKLKDGEEYSLFSPGRFYEGASDRSIVEGWRRRLENLIRQ